MFTCYICGAVAKFEALSPQSVICKKCGKYRVTEAFMVSIANRPGADDEILLRYLSACTRQASRRGEIVTLRGDWRDLAGLHATTPVLQKVDLALKYFASESAFPGAQVKIDLMSIYPLFDAINEAEAEYLIQHLESRSDIKTYGGMEACVVLPNGWARLDPPTSGTPGHCFIAMSFDPTLNDAYELGIREALRDCKLVPVRVDRVHHNEKICDKILAEIRRSQFMVADFTMQRTGVYFEAGFALGLGRPVIWTCREDDKENLHFDTRQYNHLLWTTPSDLREKLIDRVRATIPGAR